MALGDVISAYRSEMDGDCAQGARRWSEVYERIDSQKMDHEDKKKGCSSCDDCFMVAMYVEGSAVDAQRRWKSAVCKVPRSSFDTGEREDNEKMLGLIPNKVLHREATLARELSEAEYVNATARDDEQKEGKVPREMTTTGQKKGPDFQAAEEALAGGGSLSTIGVIGYAVQGAHLDEAFSYAWIGRVTAKWWQ